MINYENSKDTNTLSLEPALLEEAERMTGDVLTYKRILTERKLVEEASVDLHRKHPGNEWSFADGYYRRFQEDEPERIGGHMEAPLSGMEVLWAQRINEALSHKQGSGKPVVMMDFGGGFGFSLMRLGAQDTYRQAIENGDLVLVATNLGYIPTDEPDSDGYTAVAKDLNTRNTQGNNLFRDDETLQFIQKNQGYVQFLDMSVTELEDATVTTLDGSPLPLKGNVDVLSEQLSLAYTHIPDIALGIFAELLDQGGTLYLNTKMGNSMHSPHFREIEVADGRTIQVNHSQNPEYYEQRGIALEVGLATATHHLGLEIIDDVYLGPAVLCKY